MTLLSSTNQLSVTGSAAALGLALALACRTDAGALALAALDDDGAGDAPPNPPEQAPTTRAARIPMTRSRVGVVVIVLLQDVEDRRTPAVRHERTRSPDGTEPHPAGPLRRRSTSATSVAGCAAIRWLPTLGQGDG